MKTIAIVICVAAFVLVCISMANDARNAKKLPEVSKDLMYKISKDKYEPGVARYEIGVDLNKEAKESDVKEISEWIKRTHKESEAFIIFYYVPGQSGAWARVDYPEYKFELMPKLEY